MTWLFASPNLVRTATVLPGPDRHGVQLSPCSLAQLNTLTGDRWGAEGPIGPGILAETGVSEAHFDAAQKRLLKLAELDPEAAAPGLAVCRGVGLAVKMAEGDRSAEEELTALLAEEAARVG